MGIGIKYLVVGIDFGDSMSLWFKIIIEISNNF